MVQTEGAAWARQAVRGSRERVGREGGQSGCRRKAGAARLDRQQGQTGGTGAAGKVAPSLEAFNRGRRDHLWVSEASLCWLCVEDRRRRGWGEGGLMEVVKIEPVRQDRDLDRGRRGQKR